MSDPIAERASALVRRTNGWIGENLTPGPAMAYGLLFGALVVMVVDSARDHDWVVAVVQGALLVANAYLYRRSVRPRLIEEGGQRALGSH